MKNFHLILIILSFIFISNMYCQNFEIKKGDVFYFNQSDSIYWMGEELGALEIEIKLDEIHKVDSTFYLKGKIYVEDSYNVANEGFTIFNANVLYYQNNINYSKYLKNKNNIDYKVKCNFVEFSLIKSDTFFIEFGNYIIEYTIIKKE